MASRTEVTIPFDELDAACKHSTKGLRVRGAKALLPSDTLLSADPEGVLVETFALTTLVLANKGWIFNVSVDAKKLIALCGVARKLGAKGQSVKLDLAGRDLVMTLGTTRLTLPTLWVK